MLCFISCRQNEDPDTLDNQEKLIQVYVELIKLQERFPIQYPAYIDSSRQILQSYHFTKEEYNQALSYFNEKPERWHTFYQKVLEQIEKD